MPEQQSIDSVNQAQQNDIKKCPHCQMDISSLADKCPYCQSKISKPRSGYDGIKLIVTAIIIVFGFFYLLTLLPDDDSSEFSSLNEAPVQSVQPTQIEQTMIELRSINFSYEEIGTFRIIRFNGEIKNISDQPLGFVEVIVEFRDKDNNFIISERTYPELVNLLPGQTSTFKYHIDDNPTISLQKSTIKFIGRIGSSTQDIELPYKNIDSSIIVPQKTITTTGVNNFSKYSKSVVKLICPNILNPDQGSFGSGIIINDKGYILTNFHVTSGVSSSIYIGFTCTVYLTNGDNTFLIPTYTAFAVSILESHDAIILRIAEDENETIINPPFNLVPLKITGIVPTIGNDITALGFPGIDSKLTLTTGKITGFETVSSQNMITISAVVEEGESGGPLLNKNEDLIGIITATKEFSKDNYAIDIRNITPWINDVIRDTSNLSSKDIVARPVDFRNSSDN